MAARSPIDRSRDALDATSTGPSRRMWWWVLEQGGIYRTSFVPGDPLATAFNEGRRSLALEILARLEGEAPGSLDLMKKEATHEAELLRQAAKGRRGRGRKRAPSDDEPGGSTVSDWDADPGDADD